jgi:rRNA maturation endonuclease Nob1
MKLKYKIFKQTFPLICTKCGKIANMPREYCESCGEKDSLRPTTREDHAKFEGEQKFSNKN